MIPPVAGERVHEFHMTIDLTDIKSIEIGGVCVARRQPFQDLVQRFEGHREWELRWTEKMITADGLYAALLSQSSREAPFLLEFRLAGRYRPLGAMRISSGSPGAATLGNQSRFRCRRGSAASRRGESRPDGLAAPSSRSPRLRAWTRPRRCARIRERAERPAAQLALASLKVPSRAAATDLPLKEPERLYHWPLGRRPDDHPGLSELGL